MKTLRTPQRGTALIITVGLLAVLAVVGFGFAVVMRLHYDTARYYRATSEIELLSHAAVFYTVNEIRYGYANARPAPPGTSLSDPWHSRPAGAFYEPTDSPMSPWYVASTYERHRPTFLYKDDDGKYRYYPERDSSYVLVHDVLGDKVAVSRCKAVDAASQININDHNRNALIAMLDTLFYELNVNDNSKNGTGIDNLTAQDNPYAVNLTGEAIINYRDTLPGDRFSCLRQLTEKHADGSPRIAGMTERRYDVLKHYLTIYSWPHNPPSVTGFDPGIVSPDGQGGLQYEHDDPGANALRRRSPININTAPYEVLVAVLAHIKTEGGTSLGASKAREVAKWILRRRDPENPDHWPTGAFSIASCANWRSWLEAKDYTMFIRNMHPTYPNVPVTAARNFPLGPFDNWNEMITFFYHLTDGAALATGRDPFDQVLAPPRDAEAIIAATSPNSFASFLAYDTWHMGYSRGGMEWNSGAPVMFVERFRRDRDPTGNTERPEPTGKEEIDTTGYTTEFCFSSKGRFEMCTRTFAFVKADYGTATAGSTRYRLQDDTKHWQYDQWRGYSVLIYDGEGKGQLRGIARNTENELLVARWSTDLSTTPGGDQSRYYICGPGPMVVRVDMNDDGSSPGNIKTDNYGAFLRDEKATWEDDQWNGYRVVVYRGTKGAPITTPSGKTIYQEDADSTSIQERLIIDTVGRGAGRTPRLVLSPELREDVGSGTHWSYIILGSYGHTAHEAAVKAYDVIYHNTQHDFTGGGYATTKTVVGPNPKGVVASRRDGWIAVEDEQAKRYGAGSAFLLNLDNGLNPVGGSYAGGTAELTDVYEGGCLQHDGLHLRSVGNQGVYVAYDVNEAIVTNEPTDGGFVSLWFRPDRDCMVGGKTRTLIRIKGSSPGALAGEHDDIRLILHGTTLKLVVRASGKAIYGKLNTFIPPDYTNLQQVDVKCRKFTTPFTGPSIDVSNKALSQIPAPWEPGQWHHIAFAWYEAYDSSTLRDDDAKPSDPHSDIPPYDQLDEGQTHGRLRLWVDGNEVQNVEVPNGFNLIPGAEGVLHIGEPENPGACTVDGVVAFGHTDKQLTSATLTAEIRQDSQIFRYKGAPFNSASHLTSYGTYRSPTIQLPRSQHVCLGTAAFTTLLPFRLKRDSFVYADQNYFPASIQVHLSGQRSVAVPNIDSTSPYPAFVGNSPCGSGGELRRNEHDVRATIHASTSSLYYEIRLSALSGYNGANNYLGDYVYFPRFWSTPVVEDVTITFLGDVVFYHWR